MEFLGMGNWASGGSCYKLGNPTTDTIFLTTDAVFLSTDAVFLTTDAVFWL
jgi:hypothetical protein